MGLGTLTCAFLLPALSPPSLSKCITEPPGGAKVYKDTWDFGPYLEILNASVGDTVFQHPAWIEEYFTWAGFKDYNLVVRVGHSAGSSLLSRAVGVVETRRTRSCVAIGSPPPGAA